MKKIFFVLFLTCFIFFPNFKIARMSQPMPANVRPNISGNINSKIDPAPENNIINKIFNKDQAEEKNSEQSKIKIDYFWIAGFILLSVAIVLAVFYFLKKEKE